MQFENDFSVDAPIERVWSHLLDVPSVAPCLPGAQLTETVSESEYKGTVKVKLGAMQMNYKGTLNIKEIDNDAHRVVLSATGSDARGGGGASGNVTSTLSSEGPSRTAVHLVSEVNITGRVAQFGRNIIQDVSNKLVREFAACLEANLNAEAEPATVAEVELASQRISSADPTLTDDATAPSTPELSVPKAQTVAPPIPAASRPTPSGNRPPPGASEIKLMPLLVDITRSRVANGLRSLAKALDPHD